MLNNYINLNNNTHKQGKTFLCKRHIACFQFPLKLFVNFIFTTETFSNSFLNASKNVKVFVWCCIVFSEQMIWLFSDCVSIDCCRRFLKCKVLSQLCRKPRWRMEVAFWKLQRNKFLLSIEYFLLRNKAGINYFYSRFITIKTDIRKYTIWWKITKINKIT